MLDGELTFQLDDRLITAGQGELAFARRGVHHTLANRSSAQARYLLVCTPGGFERYFDRSAAEQGGGRAPAPASKPYAETVVVGPPIEADRESGTRMPAPAGPIRVLLRAEDSDGQVSIMDNAVSAGAKGPPLHKHDFDETFYVLDGEVTFQLEDRLITAKAGEVAFAPRNVPHTFANVRDQPARQLLVCTAAGFERYFARIAAREEGVEPPPWALQPIPEVTRVGPRIGDRR